MSDTHATVSPQHAGLFIIFLHTLVKRHHGPYPNYQMPGISQRRGGVIKGSHSGHRDGESIARELVKKAPISPCHGLRGHSTIRIRSRGPIPNR